MTEFDLLELIGQADDQYILASRRRMRKRSFPWAKALAACLAIAVVGFAGTRFFHLFGRGMGSSAAPAAVETYEADEGTVTAETWDTAEDEDAPMEAVTASDYGATLLAQAEYPEAPAYGDYETRSAIWQANQTSQETQAALNAFAYGTAARILTGTRESGAYSPLSLYQALSLLASGANGTTRDQLLSLLGQGDLETLADQAGKLYRVNYADNGTEALQIANSLWLGNRDSAGNTLQFSRDWVMSAARSYYADVYAADFSSPETSQALGAWIAEHTGGLLHPDAAALSLRPNTLMTIVNALYYRAPWQSPFEEALTAPDDFTSEDGAVTRKDFMHRTEESGRYVRTDTYTKSTLYLSRGRMDFVLPAEGVSLDSLLTEESLWTIFENGDYRPAEVHWSVPKFSTDSTFSLAEPLQAMGITDAFGSTADFSAISDTPLTVNQIRQGTHLSLDETGVEAAAFTAVEMAGGIAEEDQEILDMNLNRPFLYLITADDGSILFIGTVR